MTRYGDIARLINGLWSPQGSTELHAAIYFPLRREGRMLSAEPVCSCAFCFVQTARETAGAARTRSSLRPLVFEGAKRLHNSGASRGEGTEPCPSKASAFCNGEGALSRSLLDAIIEAGHS